ncbi:MAG: hypothetical protein M1828_003653 [Chrysothrix sp. TS-e1954]|nr:MAG: hypothetical protein M1828_003653 [Chrysothrix sp. TS-e1954]
MAISELLTYSSTVSPFLLLLPFILTYLSTCLQAFFSVHTTGDGKKPPVAPYWIPGLGHALPFLWRTSNVSSLTGETEPRQYPVRLQLGPEELNFVSGSENIVQVWRAKALEAKAVTCFSLSTFFNTPKKSMKIYHKDNSGINVQPNPHSNTAHKDRYYYHTRKETIGFFSGPALKHFANRFQSLLMQQTQQVEVGHDWVDMPDLYRFVQDVTFAPAIEAMCGPTILEQTPDLQEIFWQFDMDMYYFFKGAPRWLHPKAWRNRDRLLDSLKRWHAHASEYFFEASVEADGHDPFYGSPLMRRRAEYLPTIECLDDADALASQDLGLIWAENANSIPAVFWLMLELLQRPEVFRETRTEIKAAQVPFDSGNGGMDIDTLCSKPFLQSSFAETLRLYTSLFALRNVGREPFKIGKWCIGSNKLIAVDSRVAHMDQNTWNTEGTSVEDSRYAPRPLDGFWPERFLEYPGDPSSGPLKFNPNKPKATGASVLDQHGSSANPKFTMEGLNGAWLPFGGGIRQCPGKNFAKQEVIMSFAVLTEMFEFELTGQDPVKPDMKYYGLGTFPPTGKTPFRIRRRR